MTSGSRLGAPVAALGVVLATAGFILNGSRDDAGLEVTAWRGTLSVTLTEAGVLRAVDSAIFRSPLEGRDVEIMFLAPEGARVREGDLLARLDASPLQAEHERALEAVRQIQTEIQGAVLDREEAEIAVSAVAQGPGSLAVEEARTDLRLADARARLLREAHDRLRPLLAKGYVTRDELDRARLELDEADARGQMAARALEVLVERTRPDEERTARLNLARREAQLAHLQQRLDQARAYAASLAESIARCAIRAPRPGLVMHEENLSTMPRRKVRAGDRVTPSQGLISLPDLRRMTVQASVRESDVHLVAPGQRARVHVEAFPGIELRGVVARLGVLVQSRVELVVDLEPTGVDLRPGMSARVDVFVDERRDVVLVPVTAVFTGPEGAVCYVRTGAGIERRAVELGRASDAHLEIVQGVQPGDRLLLAEPGRNAR